MQRHSSDMLQEACKANPYALLPYLQGKFSSKDAWDTVSCLTSSRCCMFQKGLPPLNEGRRVQGIDLVLKSQLRAREAAGTSISVAAERAACIVVTGQ
jgi:hypothetical protein